MIGNTDSGWKDFLHPFLPHPDIATLERRIAELERENAEIKRQRDAAERARVYQTSELRKDLFRTEERLISITDERDDLRERIGELKATVTKSREMLVNLMHEACYHIIVDGKTKLVPHDDVANRPVLPEIFIFLGWPNPCPMEEAK